MNPVIPPKSNRFDLVFARGVTQAHFMRPSGKDGQFHLWSGIAGIAEINSAEKRNIILKRDNIVMSKRNRTKSKQGDEYQWNTP
jgi:hypothetical protein